MPDIVSNTSIRYFEDRNLDVTVKSLRMFSFVFVSQVDEEMILSFGVVHNSLATW